jgi:hypothetical protein
MVLASKIQCTNKQQCKILMEEFWRKNRRNILRLSPSRLRRKALVPSLASKARLCAVV